MSGGYVIWTIGLPIYLFHTFVISQGKTIFSHGKKKQA